MKQTTCCLTGHRPHRFYFGYDETQQDCVRLKLKLAVEIEKMRKKGVTTFLSGMAQGADIWGAEIIIDLKRAYPGELIRLIAVIPYEGQANRWSTADRERYFHILAEADENILLQSHYTRACMHKRNRYMVDASAYMIAVYSGSPGGAQYTLNYAIKKSLDIVIINPSYPEIQHHEPHFTLIK